MVMRAGEVLTADPDGPKLLVLVASGSPCVVTYRGLVLRPGQPDPCSQPAPGAAGAAGDVPLRPGDLLEDRQTGLVIRCIRGGTSEVRCDGRRLVRRT
jgi:hypothetical protein